MPAALETVALTGVSIHVLQTPVETLSPTITIREGSDATAPGDLLYTLEGGSLASTGEQNFTVPSGTGANLAPNTSYYAQLDADAPDNTNAPVARLAWTHVADEDPTGAPGWTISDGSSTRFDPEESWRSLANTTINIRIEGTVREAVVPNSPATGEPSILGTIQVRETLTADTGGIADADGLTQVAYSYQ